MGRTKQQIEEVSLLSIHPTKASLQQEMASLGASFQRTTYSVADLTAEATEMLVAKTDVTDLVRREYPVTEASFERIELLLEVLLPLEVEQVMLFEARKVKTAAAEETRQKLLVKRELLSRIGEAAELAPEVFMVDSTRHEELHRGMTRLVSIVRQHRAKLADKARVDDLLEEVEQLIKNEETARKQVQALSDERMLATLKADQAKRLMLDEMRHISKQGLAAYPNDPSRDRAYRLERLTNRKSKKKPDSDSDPAVPGE